MTARLLPLLIALAALLGAAAPAQALEVGMASDHLLLNGDPREAQRAVDEWRRLGIDTVRLQIVWSRVAPDPRAYQPPFGFDPANPESAGYQWHDIDRAVRMVADAGMKPILMMDGPPPLWASSKPLVGNPRYMTSAWHFGQFAAAVATRYRDLVEDYIIWNEPNLPVWLQPQAKCKGKRCTPVSPHTYRFMARAAYPAIHAADPQSRVLIGALAPSGGNLRSRNANMRPLEWIRALGCVDKKLRPVKLDPCRTFEPAIADGFAYHPHSTKHPPHEGYPRPDDAALASLKKVEKLLDALQDRGRLTSTTPRLGLWLDEYAYQTNPPDKLRGVTPGRQDRYLQQAAYIAWRDKRVKMIAQYLWHDEPIGDPGGKRYTGWQSGLLTSDGRDKPALAHFDDPLWLDWNRNVIWGQIRPGDAHEVEVQIREPGAGTAWTTLQRMTTAGDGSFFLATQLKPYHAYRAVWDGDRVTATHVAAPPSDASTGDDPTERSDGLRVERRAETPTPGASVPPNFTGMSIEWRSVPDYIGTNGSVNPIFGRLVGEVERLGGSAPTLRFGGDSTDHTWWNPDGAPKPTGIVTDITPPWLAHLNTWVRSARTPLLLGLNMGLNDPAKSAELAAAARATLPPGSIRAFELGNEPDLYSTPRTYQVGRNRLARLAKRPEGYGYPEYRREVRDHVAAIHPVAPEVPILGGGFASGAWDDLQDDIFTQEPSVRLWGVHSYPLPTCDPDIRARGGARYIPKILAPSGFSPIMDRARHLTAVAASHGAKVVVNETNSAICGGLHGVSDTFAAALWGTDLLFGLASEGVRNVDFHTWTGSNYGPVEFTSKGGRKGAEVRPLFYAFLMFAKATPPGARLLPIGPNPPGAKVKTWGTIDSKGVRRYVVINKDPYAHRKVVLTAPRGARFARMSRMTAPSLKSEYHAKFAGQGYGPFTTDGRLRGKRRTETLRTRRGAFRFVLPLGSAVLIETKGAPLRRRR